VTYDISKFHDWLEEPPEYLLEDDTGENLEAWKEKHGIRDDAPQEAKDAYKEYVKACSLLRVKITYKDCGFSLWLNNIPSNLDSEVDLSAIKECGLCDDAPQSAKREFELFVKR
jgi:hypothetical protein